MAAAVAGWAPLYSATGAATTPETPTFGRYAEVTYDEMTPEQQEGYRLVREVRGSVGGLAN